MHTGRWEARIGVPGSKHIYLGLFNEEKEAAQAYDSALVRLRGTAAATNFALSDYRQNLAEYHKMQQVRDTVVVLMMSCQMAQSEAFVSSGFHIVTLKHCVMSLHAHVPGLLPVIHVTTGICVVMVAIDD